MGEDGLMAQSNSRPGDPEQGETEQRDQSNSRAVAGVPTWALAILGAGGLAIAAGFIGYWSGNRGPALVAPVSYAGTSNSPTASATLTPGPDGLYPTPTPASTYPGVETTSGAQTATSQTETQGSLGRTTTTPGRTSKTAGVEAFNPATHTRADNLTQSQKRISLASQAKSRIADFFPLWHSKHGAARIVFVFYRNISCIFN